MDLELEFEPEALEMLPAEQGLTGGAPEPPPYVCRLFSLVWVEDPIK